MRLMNNNEAKQPCVGYLKYIKQVIWLGSIMVCMAIAGLSVTVASTTQMVNQILNTSFKFLPHVNCQGSGNLKMACAKHQDKANFHFQQAKKLAKLADAQAKEAKNLGIKASKSISSNPSIANKLIAKSNREYILSKETAAAAHANVSAAIAQKKAAISTASYGALYNCTNTNSQDLAACISSAANTLSKKVNLTKSESPMKTFDMNKVKNRVRPLVEKKN